MNAFTWLNNLMQALGRIVPRLQLIEPTHRAVRFGPRGGTRQMGPGLVAWWPLTHSVVLIPVVTQNMQPSSSVLPLTDNGPVLPRVAIVSLAIQFRVVDPIKAATKALRLHALVDNRASAALARHWPGAMPDALEFVESAANELRDELTDYGLLLERLDVTQVGVGVALKQVQDWAYSDNTNGLRDSTQ